MGAFGGAYSYGLGYNGFAGYPYGYPAVGYSAYYGKRSADAEPEADAYYGYYGYGAFPYAGYGYSAYRPYGLATVMAEASTTKSLPKESRTREKSRFIQRL